MNMTNIGPVTDTLKHTEVGVYYIYNYPTSDGYNEGMTYIRLLVLEDDAGARCHTFERFEHWGRENGDEKFSDSPANLTVDLCDCKKPYAEDAVDEFLNEEYPLLLAGELEFEEV